MRRPRPRDAPRCTAGHDLGLQRRRDKGPVAGVYCDAFGETILPGAAFWTHCTLWADGGCVALVACTKFGSFQFRNLDAGVGRYHP